MTYHIGLGAGMARLGFTPCEPHLSCDGCGIKRDVARDGGGPFAWFLDGKKAPGWTMSKSGDKRLDWCPRCKDKSAAEGSRKEAT